jgi:hypothetical protein
MVLVALALFAANEHRERFRDRALFEYRLNRAEMAAHHRETSLAQEFALRLAEQARKTGE